MSPVLQIRCASLCAWLWLNGLLSAMALAQDAGVDAAASDVQPPLSDPRADRVRALLAGALELDVEPQSLFDVDLADEAELQMEAARVRAVLRAVEEAARPALPVPRNARKKVVLVQADAGSLQHDLREIDLGAWHARVELDRARADFYALSLEQRHLLLQAHADRIKAAKPEETDAERRAREVESERQRALQVARAARTASERMIGEEVARLIGLQTAVNEARAGLRSASQAIVTRQDGVVGLQRRARDARSGTSALADATYDALRKTLRASRDDLASALQALGDSNSSIPSLGADPLVDIPKDLPTGRIYELRGQIERSIAQARSEEAAVEDKHAAALLYEVDLLNRERLGLLARLSPARRDAITGFTAVGWDQARSEALHLGLILSYHERAAADWLRAIRTHSLGISLWSIAAAVIPWLLLLSIFLWWNARAPELFALGLKRLREADRIEHRMTPTPAHTVAVFASKIHRPAERLLFFGAAMWVLPKRVNGLLEVQLLISVVGWALGGALVVATINALAATHARYSLPRDSDAAGALRLRSLQLVGRTVVALALILVLSTRLVGEGTIYQWVLSTCWIAALPVFLILVRWWRGTVFDRVARARRKTPLQVWILANRSGWKSSFAAMVGAVQLFSVGVFKILRSWLSGFDVARRVHAYFFKRGLDRLSEIASTVSLTPLQPSVLEALHPEAVAEQHLPSPCDGLLEAVDRRATALRGGVLAVVGGRGMGKSSVLRELGARVPTAFAISCGPLTSCEDICRATGVERQGAVSSSAAAAPPLVLLDDAHAIIKPVIGGLATFDETIAFARTHSASTTWVFAFDSALWPFLNRARDDRPLFDEVFSLSAWREDHVAALLKQRCERAGIAPIYDDLLEGPSREGDEVDRIDALRAKEAGYVRMLWDHSRGNPGLALEAWRSSLAQDLEGIVHVRPLHVPSSMKLDGLSDSSVFVLRAVLQLEPAAVDDVARATRLAPEQVASAFLFGQAQGYLSERDGRVRITWRWLGPILQLLERRHLLVNP